MPYPSLPDRALGYHKDGTIVKLVNATDGVVVSYTANDVDEMNDEDLVTIDAVERANKNQLIFFALPYAIEVAGLNALLVTNTTPFLKAPTGIEGSNDTTNGIDGTWVAGTAGSGFNTNAGDFDSWRKEIAPINFSGVAYSNYRVDFDVATGPGYKGVKFVHFYGVGATPTAEADLPLLFLNALDSDNEFASPLNFGDVLTGTSATLGQIKIKNNHASLTANNVVLTIRDGLSEDIVRLSTSSGGPFNLTETITSIAAGASSAVIFVKSESPAPPTTLKPQRTMIEVVAGSFT